VIYHLLVLIAGRGRQLAYVERVLDARRPPPLTAEPGRQINARAAGRNPPPITAYTWSARAWL